jgi:hypothetical protein
MYQGNYDGHNYRGQEVTIPRSPSASRESKLPEVVTDLVIPVIHIINNYYSLLINDIVEPNIPDTIANIKQKSLHGRYFKETRTTRN